MFTEVVATMVPVSFGVETIDGWFLVSLHVESIDGEWRSDSTTWDLFQQSGAMRE